MTYRMWTKRAMLAAIAASAIAISAQQIAGQQATPTPSPFPAILPTAVAPTSLIELRGIISAQNATTLSIGSQIIDISGAQVGAGVGVGQRVRIFATLAGPNLWRAQSVTLFTNNDLNAPVSTPELLAPTLVPTSTPLPATIPPPVETPEVGAVPLSDEFELVGILDAFDGQFIVVSGLPINITGAEIQTALTVGMPVKVHVNMVNGVLTAREVDDEDDLITGGQLTSVPVSAESAIAIMRSVLPNTTVREIELERRADGSPVWEIHTTDNQEIFIDAQTGAVLAIELSGRGGDDNGGDRDDDRDDNSGSGNSDDRNDDNNSGSGNSDDDSDDDNSGHGNSDDDDDD